jgi:DNA-binding transcriptional regulator PaaX
MVHKQKTVLRYILEGLIPYSEANLKLSFKPSQFFNDLEKISSRNSQSIKNAYYDAVKSGLIEFDENNIPRLTEKGMHKSKRFDPKKLKTAKLIVMFDIPELDRWKRQRLRALLKELRFRQIQKSVWQTEYDYRDYIKAEIASFGLENSVLIYEARQIK